MSVEKANRTWHAGKPKKKPDYDREEITEELLAAVVGVYEALDEYGNHPSLQAIVDELDCGLNPLKVRKLLITAGEVQGKKIYESATVDEVLSLWKEGKSVEAEIVRYIFERYVCGVSATAIAKELNAMGKKTVRGSIWRADAVLFILRNEKYVGDCESQKTVTKNFLTHEVSINEGDAPKYYVTDHHVAIIDRHTWNQAQMMLLGGEEARDKKEKKRRANNASPFTNLTYGVDGCNEPMFRIGYNTPLYTYTDERSAKAEP